jgi:tetratricopeptide (TPR) repeat protein
MNSKAVKYLSLKVVAVSVILAFALVTATCPRQAIAQARSGSTAYGAPTANDSETAHETSQPASSEPESSPGGLLTKARQLITAGRSSAAVPLLRQYTQVRGNDPDGHFWLGMALDQSGAPDQAIWAYSKSLDLTNREGMDSPELRINIGNTLMKLKRPVDAIYNYKRAIEIDSKMPLAHYNLGRALLSNGAPSEALNELNRSFELGLNNLLLPYYKALAFTALGKKEDAQSQLKLFLNTAPDTPNLAAVRSRAQALLAEPPQNR